MFAFPQKDVQTFSYMPGLNQSKIYRKFVKARDAALEQLLRNAMVSIDNTLRDLFKDWILVCMDARRKIKPNTSSAYFDMVVLKQTENRMDSFIHGAHSLIMDYISSLRTRSYALTVASEAEAIGQAFGEETKYNLQPHDLQKRERMPGPHGISFERSILHNLTGIRTKLIQQLHWLIMNPEITDQQALTYFIKKLPRSRSLGSRKRSLKPVKVTESDQGNPRDDFSSGYLDDETWEEIIDDYKKTIKVDRGPEAVIAGAPEQDPYYAWELERDVVNDFVQNVRDGQMDAAKSQGITDFVVISIVDDKTCEGCCEDYGCVDFDGLLTSEVSEMTKGKYSAPPYHFNCRCTLAPATDDIPDQPESNEKDFDAWLNS